jgi:hypothetical protein
MAILTSLTLKNREGEFFTLSRDNGENRLDLTLSKSTSNGTSKKVSNYRVTNLDAVARLVALHVEGFEANLSDQRVFTDLLDMFIRM